MYFVSQFINLSNYLILVQIEILFFSVTNSIYKVWVRMKFLLRIYVVSFWKNAYMISLSYGSNKNVLDNNILGICSVWKKRADDSENVTKVNFIETRDDDNVQLCCIDHRFICLVVLPSFESFELSSDEDKCKKKNLQFKFWYILFEWDGRKRNCRPGVHFNAISYFTLEY